MPNRISHSSVRLYAQCSKRYKLHYVDKLRPNVISGALLFGSAIDTALNDLLVNKDTEKAKTVFLAAFEYQAINGIKTYLPTANNVVYAKTDFDAELIPNLDTKTIQGEFDKLSDRKNQVGFENLSAGEKNEYAILNWKALYNKGRIMIDTYAREILPQIKQVLAIQKHIALKNDQGDEIIGYVDLIVEWKDGKRYILDNKTSTRDYDPDSASKSQQLLLYHHICKDEYKIDGGIGFIVLYKQIQKNRKKICSVCGFDGSGARHKTCNNEVKHPDIVSNIGPNKQQKGVLAGYTGRCNGEWKETIDPKARIEVILNHAPEAAEDLVLDVFDSANVGIRNKQFIPNLQACGTGDWSCPYSKLCWQGKDDSLVKV